MDVGSVAGVAAAGVAAGAALNVPTAAAPTASTGGTGASPNPADFVVSISNAAIQALRWDMTASITGAPPSRLAEDLAALALLAILEQQNQQQNATPVNIVSAIGAYLAIQTLGG